jgi:DNA processing protein
MPVSITPLEEELHWLALRLVPGLGPRKSGMLIDRFRTPQAVFRASLTELEGLGLSGSLARSIQSGCSFEEAAGQQQKMLDSGALAIPITHPLYPEPLRQIFDPPVLLFARGNPDLLRGVGFAVVGTRRPTPYGLAVSEKLSGDLARAGLTIVSGMARGIDTAAHRGALAAEGKTIAVLGCGADIVYPSENKKVAAEIVAKGLILSEFPMGSIAFPQNFPIRNRVISGICAGLLVVEGAQYSGSAITAKLALDQGRELFAVPGNITNKLSWGPNLLIKQGAKLVQDWNDVIVDLPPAIRRRLIDEGRQRIINEGLTVTSEEGLESLPPEQPSLLGGPEGEVGRKVLRILKTDAPVHLDQLLEQLSDCSSSELIAALFELEMLGLAKQMPGKNFVRVW